MFGVLVFLSVVTLVIYLYRLEKNHKEKFKEVLQVFPSPKELRYAPILGNIFVDRRGDKLFNEVFNGWDKNHKSFCMELPILGYFGLHINNAEDAEIILTSTVNIKKSKVYDFFHDWLETGLLTSTGSKWHKRRKMLTPAFHFSILRQFVETIIDNSERLVKKLELECEKNVTNIKPIISNSALNTICETSMGTKLDDESKSTIYGKYVDAVHKMSKLITYRLTRPWIHHNSIFNLFCGKNHFKYLKTLHDFTTNVIIDRENNFKVEVEDLRMENEEDVFVKKKFALLDLLLNEKRKNNIDFVGVREEVDTFMFEGHDTVSSAIVYALNTLANHPDIQEKIVDELHQIFNEDKRRTTYQDLQNMSYLEKCIKECLRLYPSVVAVERQTDEDMIIRNVTLPKGSFCMVHIYGIHRDPKHWKNPEKFYPERFSPENSIGRNPFAYIPFSAGPRNCIGQKFAMLELKSILSEILWNFVIEPVQKTEDLTFFLDVILRNYGPVNVKFNRRKHDKNKK